MGSFLLDKSTKVFIAGHRGLVGSTVHRQLVSLEGDMATDRSNSVPLPDVLKASIHPDVVRLIHAELFWTEPHSKRLLLKLLIQHEVHGAILERSHLVELTIHYQLCPTCSRAHANPDQRSTAVQLHQHVAH